VNSQVLNGRAQGGPIKLSHFGIIINSYLKPAIKARFFILNIGAK